MFWKLRYRILIARSEHSTKIVLDAVEQKKDSTDTWGRLAWDAQIRRYMANADRLRARARRIEIRGIGRRRRRMGKRHA